MEKIEKIELSPPKFTSKKECDVAKMFTSSICFCREPRPRKGMFPESPGGVKSFQRLFLQCTTISPCLPSRNKILSETEHTSEPDVHVQVLVGDVSCKRLVDENCAFC